MQFWYVILFHGAFYASSPAQVADMATCERRAPVISKMVWERVYPFRLDVHPQDVTVKCVRSAVKPSTSGSLAP